MLQKYNYKKIKKKLYGNKWQVVEKVEEVAVLADV